jgi:hypothetical protein
LDHPFLFFDLFKKKKKKNKNLIAHIHPISGRKPKFNWKEKKKLGLYNIKEIEEFKVRPYGDAEEILKFFDPERGRHRLSCD